MTYVRFEDLPVWKAAVDLAVAIYSWTSGSTWAGHRGLRDQIERASVSISNNIAKGFDRGTHDELISFLYIARGSAAEVRSMLSLIERLPIAPAAHESIPALRRRAEDIAHQLNRWLQKLKDSDRQGPRFENSETRERTRLRHRRDEFLAHLDDVRKQATSSPDSD